MSGATEDLTVAELRALMRRPVVEGDRCSCGAVFHRHDWDILNTSGSHSHYPRHPYIADGLERSVGPTS